MNLLYLSLHPPLDPARVATGNQVRVAGLAAALAAAGHLVRVAWQAAPGTAAESGGYAFADAAALAALLRRERPQALLVGYWRLLEWLPERAAPAVPAAPIECPVVLDFIAPRLLEAQYQEPGLCQQEARELLRLLPRADQFLVSHRRQADLLLPLLLQAGFDCRVRAPILEVPLGVGGEPAAGAASAATEAAVLTSECATPAAAADGSATPPGLRLVSAGVDWPWRQSAGFDTVIAAWCARHPGSVFDRIGGDYPDPGKPDPGKPTTLLTQQALQARYRQAHIGVELCERNLEREFSQSFRMTDYLEAGLPVLLNAWLPAAALIARYEAGWLVEDAAALPALLDAIAADPAQLARRSAGARRLAREALHYRQCAAPLYDYLRQPWRPQRLAAAAPGPAPAVAAAPRLWRLKAALVQLYQGLFCRRHPARKTDVLVVTRGDLFPTDHGAAVKIVRTAESLSRLGRRVYLCSDDRREYRCLEAGVMTTLRYPLWVRLCALPRRLALLRLLLRGYPWSNAFLYFPLKDFSYAVRALYVATRHATGASLAEFPAYVQPLRWVRLFTGGRIVLVEHNVEYERLRAQVPSLSAAAFAQIRRDELQLCAQAEQVIAVSENDRRQLLRDGVRAAQLHVIPHGVDLAAFATAAPAPVRERYGIAAEALLLVYHGTYSYPPNREAMEVMAREILPRLAARGVAAQVLAIGSRPPAGLSHPALHFTGSVPELAPLLKAADLAVVPLLEGGGTRMKILDYFAAGVPVLSTTKGIEGIPVRNGVEALVVDDFDAIADAIAALAHDPERRAALAAQASAFVAELGWDALARRYLPLLGLAEL